MSKYLTIMKIAWQNEFTYRLNFVLWRLRVVLRIFMTYFLWRGVFVHSGAHYGYDQNEIVTYLFMIFVVSALVFSTPASEHIGDDIASANLSNFLVKPLNYLKIVFTSDIASKLLNLSFAWVEISLLFLLIHPVFHFNLNLLNLIGFFILVFFAIFLYFFLNVLSRSLAFWTPEDTWPLAFLLYVLAEVLGGVIFPLDVLPKTFQTLLQFTPFPYLVYFPIAAFTGRIAGPELLRIIIQSGIWLVIIFLLSQYVWRKGLNNYSAEGR